MTFVSAALAAEKAEPKQPNDDVQDVLFLAPQRPVLIRMHIRNGNAGFREAWSSYVAKAFGAQDTNHDGQLSGDEIERFRKTGDPMFRNVLAELSESTRSRTQEALLERHTGAVRCVAFSPDSRTLASGADDNTVKLWDLVTGKLKATLSGHDDAVRAVEFSPDGKTIASGSKDGTVKLWNAATCKLKATLEGHDDYVTSVAFSPDGKTVASSAFDNTVKLWNSADGKLKATLQGHDDPVWTVVFSPDGRTLASGGEDKHIRLWDSKTGKQKSAIATPVVWCLAYSPDGKTLVASGPEHTIALWNVETGKSRQALKGHSGPVRSVAFSSDGKRLVSAGWDKSVRVWSIADGKNTLTIEGHTDYVECARFSPDGSSVVSGSDDRSLRCWDAVAGTERPFLRVGTLDVAQLSRLLVAEQLGAFRSVTIRSSDIVNAATGQNESQGSATNQLIARLDTDGNGRISPSELENAHESLRKLDWDDDETIQLEELFIVETQETGLDRPGRRRAAFADPFISAGERGELSDEAVRAIVAKYNRLEPVPEFAPTPVPTLTGREIGFDQALFKKLDVNGDGRLDYAELKQLLKRLEPDVELAIRIGARGKGQPAVELLKRNDASGIALAGPPGTNGVAFAMGQNELEIAAADDDTDAEQYYLERFKQADADNNGYLEPAEVKSNPVFENVFVEIDADNDKKVFPAELIKYLTERRSAAASRIVLTALVEGHNLFDILDVDGDGRLSRREFALAAGRLGAWDSNGDGELDQDEIPEHFRLELSRANPSLPGMPRASVNRGRAPKRQPAERTGPAWFQKMDRNKDGDVSQREFLGPPSTFDKLDTNHDGLIDATEAAK